jgi:soluble lytic murein transglycosylase-like protein
MNNNYLHSVRALPPYHTTEFSGLAATQRTTARAIAVVAGSVLVAIVLGMSGPSPIPIDTDPPSLSANVAVLPPRDPLYGMLDSTQRALALVQLELERARALIHYSSRYKIAADMAALIYDTAVEESIDPEVGFRLVKVESAFDTRAVSSAGALGLAQVMPNTARYFKPDLRDDDLFDRELNLRIGFRYLHDLIVTFEGDLPLALIAYNRGPGRLRQLIAGGIAPWNGYASSVLGGLNGYQVPVTRVATAAGTQ